MPKKFIAHDNEGREKQESQTCELRSGTKDKDDGEQGGPPEAASRNRLKLIEDLRVFRPVLTASAVGT